MDILPIEELIVSFYVHYTKYLLEQISFAVKGVDKDEMYITAILVFGQYAGLL